MSFNTLNMDGIYNNEPDAIIAFIEMRKKKFVDKIDTIYARHVGKLYRPTARRTFNDETTEPDVVILFRDGTRNVYEIENANKAQGANSLKQFNILKGLAGKSSYNKHCYVVYFKSLK